MTKRSLTQSTNFFDTVSFQVSKDLKEWMTGKLPGRRKDFLILDRMWIRNSGAITGHMEFYQ